MSKVIFNPSSLKQTVDKIIEVAAEGIRDAVFKDIVRRSPVRSGLFKKSWQKDRGRNLKYKISNPQPYAGALERGRSKQAPRGIVKPAIENITQPIRRYR